MSAEMASATSWWSNAVIQFGPLVIQFAQFLATSVLAYFAYSIAKRQWKTANDKLIIDLFERRMKVIKEIDIIVSNILRNGKTDTYEYFSYMRAIDDASFLFGDDINEYLAALGKNINQLGCATSSTDREAMMKYFSLIQDYFVNGRPLFRDYVSMKLKISR